MLCDWLSIALNVGIEAVFCKLKPGKCVAKTRLWAIFSGTHLNMAIAVLCSCNQTFKS